MVSDAQKDKIIELLMLGQSARECCERAGVPLSDYLKALRDDSAFSDMRDIAEIEALGVMASDLLSLADDPFDDALGGENDFERARCDILAAKFKSETVRWFLERRLPEKYTAGINVADISPKKRLSTSEIDARIVALTAKQGGAPSGEDSSVG